MKFMYLWFGQTLCKIKIQIALISFLNKCNYYNQINILVFVNLVLLKVFNTNMF